MARTLCIFLMVWTVCRGENASKCSAAPGNRFDCSPEKVLNKEECEARGCCYIPVDDSLGAGPPACFFPPDYPNYKMTDFTETKCGYTGTLVRTKHTFMPNDVMKLRMDVLFETQHRLRIIVSTANAFAY